MVERTVSTQLGEVRVSRAVREKVSRAAELVAGHPFLESEADRALHRAGVTAILEGRTKVTSSGAAGAHIEAFLNQAEEARQKAYLHQVLRGEPLTHGIDFAPERTFDSQPMPNTLPRHIKKGLKRLAAPYSEALRRLGVPERSADEQTHRLVATKVEAVAAAPELTQQVLIAQGIMEMVTGMSIPTSVMSQYEEPRSIPSQEELMGTEPGSVLRDGIPVLI